MALLINTALKWNMFSKINFINDLQPNTGKTFKYDRERIKFYEKVYFYA